MSWRGELGIRGRKGNDNLFEYIIYLIARGKDKIMKMFKMLVPVVILMLTGCAHNMPVTGVCSYFNAGRLDKVSSQRAIMQSEFAPEKKQQLFVAMNQGMDSEDIQIGMGVNVLAIGNSGLTFMEKVQQFCLCLLDIGIDYGAGKLGADAIDKINDKDDAKDSISYGVNGNGNTTIINTGNGTVKVDNSVQKE